MLIALLAIWPLSPGTVVLSLTQHNDIYIIVPASFPKREPWMQSSSFDEVTATVHELRNTGEDAMGSSCNVNTDLSDSKCISQPNTKSRICFKPPCLEAISQDQVLNESPE